jgi:hypothetical protein
MKPCFGLLKHVLIGTGSDKQRVVLITYMNTNICTSLQGVYTTQEAKPAAQLAGWAGGDAGMGDCARSLR